MSTKRQATTELNHDNWDQEDPTEQEEVGGFKMAPKEVLEKRVIRTAKRRSQAISDEAQKSVFSGFSGFNKAQKTSFDFLSNLTNGSKSNGSPVPKSDTAVVSCSSMTIKPAASPSSGIFSLSGTATPIAKSALGQPTSESIFGGIGTTPVFTQSVFTQSKPDSTVIDSPFKGQSLVSSTPNVNFLMKSNSSPDKPKSQVSSTLFGVPSTNTSSNNSPFSIKTNSPNPFKSPIASSPQSSEHNTAANKSDIKDENQLLYYNKLKGLNESVSAWIKKHVEETPLCILSPIFKDYERHLKEIQDEYEKSKEQSAFKNITATKQNNKEDKTCSVTLSGNNLAPTLLPNSTTSSSTLFSSNITVEKTSNFTFGINTSSTITANNLPTTTIASTGFSFGIKSSSASSPFGSNITTSAKNGNAPFSFGTGKPFAFNSNIKKSDEQTKEGDDNEDEPPKVEYKPIAEENSVYDIKCKVFVKKDSDFIDKGVGTLYVKKIEESGKHQLLVRANTSLGNVIINLILSSSIPTQRMGKNNVVMVCMPTPDSKPPPTSVLIRVKTSEDADELLETLNKFKA